MFGKKGSAKKKSDDTSSGASKSTATKEDISGSVFAKNVNFERRETPEEKAQKAGVIANTANLAFLTVFGAFSGIILLCISIYLSHLEAVNAAQIIAREGQYYISLGLSLASAIFSVIGFQYIMRWWKYKNMAEFLPSLVKKTWTSDEKRKVLYDIMIRVLEEGRFQSGALGLIFLVLNTICSAITLWAIVSAMGEGVHTSAWIYTFAISILAFISGACISLITNADINEKYVISMSQGRYMDYADAQSASDIVTSGK